MLSLSSFFQILEAGARPGTCWYSMVHMVTTIIGAGVLSIPSAMVYLGWWGGMSMLVVSYGITFSTLWQMVHLHHCEGDKRLDRFADLGEHAFGRAGRCCMFVLQMLLQVSVCIAYMVTGGYGVSLIFHLEGSQQTLGILIFAAAQFLVCLIPNFESLTLVSTVAMFMSIGYSTIIWATAIELRNSDAAYSIPKNDRIPKTLNALGQIAFAYGGQNVVLEVQSTIRAPSEKTMWHGIVLAYLAIAFCYFLVAGIAYWAFGNLTCYENVLQLLAHPRPTFYAANLMLVLHLTGSYQVHWYSLNICNRTANRNAMQIYALPVYDILQPYFNKMVRPLQVHFERVTRKPFNLLALVLSRYSYIALTGFLAVLIPFFNNIIGFIGGLTLAPTAFVMPCIMWLAIKKPARFSLSWLANMACIVFGVILTILALIGSLWDLILGMKTQKHKVFQFPRKESCPT